MNVMVRTFEQEDISRLKAIWNEVIEDGVAFPQMELLDDDSAANLFNAQSRTLCLVEEGNVIGLSIIHPNNVGRCGHIANASYAIDSAFRGRGYAKMLVLASLEAAKECGFQAMQFNAVVAGNLAARTCYAQCGFEEMCCISDGFLLKDGTYSDIYVLVRKLD